MYIGNVVSETKTNLNICFNTVSDIKDIIPDIPTLIIGWDLVKKIYGDNKPSILEKKINNLFYWEFSKKEKRIDYDNGLINFIKICFEEINTQIQYKFIDVLTIKYNLLKKILNILNNDYKFYIYVKNNSFAYILINKNVYGLDFNSTDFIGIDRKKIYRKLYSKNNVLIFNDDLIPKELKKEIKQNKITPYILRLIKENGR